MLKISDHLPAISSSRFWLVRRALIALSVMLAVGASAVGTGRTFEASSAAKKTAIQRVFATRPVETVAAASAATEELMHEVATDSAEVVRPNMLSTQSVTAIMPVKRPREILMEVTAYCACKKCCGPNAIGLTASGRSVSYNAGRFVAADTTVLPFGTKLAIPGYHGEQPVEVIDRGSAIKGNKLDVFYPSHEEALRWGRQTIRVTIVE